MNTLTWGLITLIVLVGGFFMFNTYIYQEKQADDTVSEAPERDVYLQQFAEESIGIAFDYPEGADGYVIDDLSATVSTESEELEVVKAYRIMNAKEKLELKNSDVGREGPPAILLTVYTNDSNQSASTWVDSFSAVSNIEMLVGESRHTSVVGGVDAVRYTTDGLYLNDTVIVANGDFIYHFTGSYLEPDSVIHQDFKAIIDSVRFVPPVDVSGSSSARIDVRVACESALAYTLFQTGEQAEQFVAECVAGEHPDVIERYINDRRLDNETI